MTKPRHTPLTPAIYADQLAKTEAAADLITQVGHAIRPALGLAWDRQASKLYRTIMDFQFRLRQAIIAEQRAVTSRQADQHDHRGISP